MKYIYTVMALRCQIKLKAKRPKLKAYALITLLLCLNSMAQGQTNFNKNTTRNDYTVSKSLPLGEGKGGAPLRVGDKLPETFWQQEHTLYADGTTIKQTLEKYKGKLLILDFWATWCSSCIYKFGTLEKLQEQYQGQLAILLVNSTNTKDKEQRVAEQLAGRRAPHQKFRLASIVNDTVLDALFPHRALPHYVWIDTTGTVSAITGADFVNREQVHYFFKANTAKP
ncbi:TlpA family protein disulfide reductase [Pedobacter helvus]|uniref:TlpA family protein disulfide reductase n=1 Tax=Pedobacter helvus TaxID=2563444 RepID=A0ABW9JLL3_9SPHI|nr:TlpA disulfide reductase family protein [Pedobacter ureilyticus]